MVLVYPMPFNSIVVIIPYFNLGIAIIDIFST